MIFDSQKLLDEKLPQFDICIIGAGPAGITLAIELEKSGKTICLLESGGEYFEEDSQLLNTGFDEGLPSGAISGRLRQFGGASNHWGGRTGTLDELDMVDKAWAPKTGWPISRADLAPFYERARALCGLAHQNVPKDALAKLPTPFRAGTKDLSPYGWWYTPKDGDSGFNFYLRNKAKLAISKKIFAVSHANVTHFMVEPKRNTIEAVKVRSFQRWNRTIRAKKFIICCGGIENCRLLLVGDGTRPIGNANTGRYVMQHLRGRVAQVYNLPSSEPIAALFAPPQLTRGGGLARYQLGMQISPECRRREGLLNASLFFEYRPTKGIEAVDESRMDFGQGRWPSDVGQRTWDLVTDSYLLSNLLNIGKSRQLLWLNNAMCIDVEQLPNPDSRIKLSNSRDKLGVPLPIIDWRSSELERRTIRKLTIAMTSELARSGKGRSKVADWVMNDNIPLSDGVYATFHYIGGTRMSSSSTDGVVDSDCKVYGTDNLYVAGSSVFPSGGHINPTLTILALTVRLADHLSKI